MSDPKQKNIQRKKKHTSNLDKLYRKKKVKLGDDVEEQDQENLDQILASDSEQIQQQEQDSSEEYDNLQKTLLMQQQYQQQNQEEDDDEDENENQQQLHQQVIQEEEEDQNAAWVDEDDQNITVDISRVARLRKLRKNPEEKEITGDDYQRRLKKFYNEKLHQSSFYSWAFNEGKQNLDSDQDEEDENETDAAKQKLLEQILKQDNTILKSRGECTSLPQEVLDLEKFASVRFQDKHDAVIQSIDFHQNSQIFLTAALDKMVKIYNIRDSAKSEYREKLKLIKSIYLENMPIEQAKFLSSRGEIIASGLKKHLLCIDLQKDKIEKISSNLFTQRFHKKLGKFVLSNDNKFIALFNKAGFFLMILDAKSKQFLFEIKVTEAIASIDFSYDSNYVFVLGNAGSIYQYCLKKRTIFDVIQDESVSPLILKAGKGQVATGSASGIVNIYSENSFDNKLIPTPVKEIQNLTTEISSIDFNYSNELLFIGSRWKRNSVRFAHVPSYGVYQNWPNFKTNLSFVSTTAFSFDNKFFASGNEKGQVTLYNLNHFNNISNQVLI